MDHVPKCKIYNYKIPSVKYRKVSFSLGNFLGYNTKSMIYKRKILLFGLPASQKSLLSKHKDKPQTRREICKLFIS